MEGMNDGWNIRPRCTPEESRLGECVECRTTFRWQKVGDFPDRCGPCSKRHNARLNGVRSQANPWGDDLQMIEDPRDLYERADQILHWSPSLQRWLINDGNRWYPSLGGEDVYRIGLQLMTDRIERKRGRKSKFRPAVESFVESFKAWCETRASE